MILFREDQVVVFLLFFLFLIVFCGDRRVLIDVLSLKLFLTNHLIFIMHLALSRGNGLLLLVDRVIEVESHNFRCFDQGFPWGLSHIHRVCACGAKDFRATGRICIHNFARFVREADLPIAKHRVLHRAVSTILWDRFALAWRYRHALVLFEREMTLFLFLRRAVILGSLRALRY